MNRIMAKKRLDLIVFEKGLAPSRQRARALILAGKVLVENVPQTKAGTQISVDANIRVRGVDQVYVSRGGLKLEPALAHFKVPVTGLVCLDVGASTGGFTDCLLRHGAKQVMAVDVGYGQLAWTLRQDPRVLVFERTNIRYMKPGALPSQPDFAVIDASFISLALVLGPVLALIGPKARILALVKPQFEVGRAQLGKKGVVRDQEKRLESVEKIGVFGQSLGLSHHGVFPSPVPGPKGNREFFILFGREG